MCLVLDSLVIVYSIVPIDLSIDLRRVARERGRVRMLVLASMWHVMVPKAPLGCLPIAGYHVSGSLACNSLTAAIRL